MFPRTWIWIFIFINFVTARFSLSGHHCDCYQTQSVAKTAISCKEAVLSPSFMPEDLSSYWTETTCENFEWAPFQRSVTHLPYQSSNGFYGPAGKRVLEVHALQESQQIQCRLLSEVQSSMAGSDRSTFCRPKECSAQIASKAKSYALSLEKE